MKYILVGYKIDEETGEIYDIDILETSETQISITDEREALYHTYNVLKVYKEER